MKTVLITGATGTTGGYAIKHLKDTNVKIKALVRTVDDKSTELVKNGIEIVQGDFLDFNSIKSALRNVDAAYFCYPFHDQLPKATTYFAKAAKHHDISLIVNMSQMNVHERSSSPATQNHLVSEQIFDWSGIDTLHLRPTLFAWNYLGMAAPTISKMDTFYFPNPEASYSIIHPEDIGEVVAKLLVEPRSKRPDHIVKLTGDSIYTNESLTALFSDILRRKINYEPIAVDEWIQVVRTMPSVNDFLVEHLREFSKDIESGRFDCITSEVLDITSHRPRPITGYFEQNLALFN